MSDGLIILPNICIPIYKYPNTKTKSTHNHFTHMKSGMRPNFVAAKIYAHERSKTLVSHLKQQTVAKNAK